MLPSPGHDVHEAGPSPGAREEKLRGAAGVGCAGQAARRLLPLGSTMKYIFAVTLR